MRGIYSRWGHIQSCGSEGLRETFPGKVPLIPGLSGNTEGTFCRGKGYKWDSGMAMPLTHSSSFPSHPPWPQPLGLASALYLQLGAPSSGLAPMPCVEGQGGFHPAALLASGLCCPDSTRETHTHTHIVLSPAAPSHS